MAVPTITALLPTSGPTGGKTLVQITGTNFQVPPTPATTGVVGDLVQTVAVSFGGQPATRVRVFSATMLQCLSPESSLSPDSPEGAVSVVLSNINSQGAVIGAETVTQANAFTYFRPKLTNESFVAQVSRRLIQELKRHVVPTVALSTAFDFDSVTGDQAQIVDLPSTPAIILSGPRMIRSRTTEIGRWRSEVYDQNNQRTKLHRTARYYDLEYRLTLVTEGEGASKQLLNLVEATIDFVDRLAYLPITDPISGLAGRLEMDILQDGEFEIVGKSVNSNLMHASGKVMIFGVGIEGVAGIADDGVFEQDAIVATTTIQDGFIDEDV